MFERTSPTSTHTGPTRTFWKATHSAPSPWRWRRPWSSLSWPRLITCGAVAECPLDVRVTWSLAALVRSAADAVNPTAPTSPKTTTATTIALALIGRLSFHLDILGNGGNTRQQQ